MATKKKEINNVYRADNFTPNFGYTFQRVHSFYSSGIRGLANSQAIFHKKKDNFVRNG